MMLWWFLPYNNVNQPKVLKVCVCVSSLQSLLPPCPAPPSHPSRSSQCAKLGSLCYTAASHQLSILFPVMYICQCYCLNWYHPLLPPQQCFFTVAYCRPPLLPFSFCKGQLSAWRDLQQRIYTENYDIMEKVISHVRDVEINCCLNSEEGKGTVTLRERRRWRK